MLCIDVISSEVKAYEPGAASVSDQAFALSCVWDSQDGEAIRKLHVMLAGEATMIDAKPGSDDTTRSVPVVNDRVFRLTPKAGGMSVFVQFTENLMVVGTSRAIHLNAA